MRAKKVSALLACAAVALGVLSALTPAPADAATYTVTSSGGLSVPDGRSSGATRELGVAGEGGLLTGITVTLNSVLDGSPADLDIELVGPTGVAVMLMSD